MSPSIEEIFESLLHRVRSYGPCVVAFSGGVDSAVVAKAAHLAHPGLSLAVTAVSPSLSRRDYEDAERCAARIGIRHRTIRTREIDNPNYVRNSGDRCFHCKNELYSRLQSIMSEFADAVILNGTNADDLDDYRPGLEAAKLHRVKSPLAEIGMTKQDVREIARVWDIELSEKPASPCLSSRIAYGVEVTRERLRMIEAAEELLRGYGFREIRVRCRDGDVARIEVPVEEVKLLTVEPTRGDIHRKLTEIGFRNVTIEQEGFKSGRLNEALADEELYRITGQTG